MTGYHVAVAACPPVWSFFGTAPRRVEVDVLASVAAASTRSAAVYLAGFVIDVGTLAGLRRDVATVCRFVGTGVVGTVAALKVALGCMIGAVVLVARVAFTLTKSILGSVGVARSQTYVVDGFGGVLVGHGALLGSQIDNAPVDRKHTVHIYGPETLGFKAERTA